MSHPVPTAKDAEAIVERIKPILAGRSPELQGEVLADLLAIWLAGHIAPGDPAATCEMREHLLAMHVDEVRELIPINAKIMND
jgi:hypothetical protein